MGLRRLRGRFAFRRRFFAFRRRFLVLQIDQIPVVLVEEAYERMKWDVNASHILIKCDLHAVPADTLKAYNKTMELRKRIMSGEDFGDVAVEASEDPSARDQEAIPGKQRAFKGNRGNLGYFTAFYMVYPFETGAYNTKEGEISMPVRSDFGYHLIKVNSKTPACGTIKAAHIFLVVDEKDPEKTPLPAPDAGPSLCCSRRLCHGAGRPGFH